MYSVHQLLNRAHKVVYSGHCSPGTIQCTVNFFPNQKLLHNSELPISCPQDLLDVFSSNPLTELEMVVLSNTSTEPMHLGMPTLLLFLEKCPNLSVLGNLKTWRRIDFYDPDSELYFKSESEFSKLKKVAVKSNWDISLDVENLDSAYEALSG